MDTTPNASPPTTEAWSTKSKKELLFGFIIVVAGIGTEPFFGSLSNYALLISLVIIGLGLYCALLGYLDR
jgi:hypothetical protein